jgi:bifunctional non-homologous end joining protein LigD
MARKAASASRSDKLGEYRRKRDFSKTAEPSGASAAASAEPRFVVQRHWARREHYDFRLEIDGVLKSWAVTKGPSARPATKRLAVRTEDHPLDYAGFEGVIPQGEYGGGTVQVWDRGTFDSVSPDPSTAVDKGMLKVRLRGERMKGDWALVRMKPRNGEARENWLLVKDRDAFAEADDTLAARHATSVATGRTRDEIASGQKAKKPTKAAAAPPAKRAVEKTKARPAVAFIPPQLCEIRPAPPEGEGWLHEMKYDGYRLQLVLDQGRARLHTREGHDWTPRFHALAKAGEALKANSAVIDGEAVVFDDEGLSDFPVLVDSLKHGHGGIALAAFDLLHLDGEDLRKLPLTERKKRLKALLGRRKSAIVYAEHLVGGGADFFKQAVSGGAEGIVSKRCEAPYRSGRSADWVKVKDRRRDDVTVLGWTPSQRGRSFASLVVAREIKGKLRYAGRVGTGFDATTQKQLLKTLEPLARATPPENVDNMEAAPKGVKWVEPGLIIEVAMAGWTGDGQVRQGAYLGVREDRSMEFERARKAVRKPGALKTAPQPDLSRLTNPGRIIFPKVKITKSDIAAYLAKMAPRIMPHLERRPVSLVRAPEGVEGERFFQRHPLKGMSRGLLPVPGGRGKRDYMEIGSAEGLVTCAQFGVLEIHGWGARSDALEKPDRLVFDLDPDEDLPFREVKKGAVQVRDFLAAAGLKSFVMASGGKGLHVVVPLEPHEDWPAIEAFCEGFAKRIARDDPARWVATMTKARRKGKIFLDYLRNKRSATAIQPFSLRAKPEASIAMPLTWAQLPRLKSANQFRMKHGLALKTDPWKGFFQCRQRIPKQALALVSAR